MLAHWARAQRTQVESGKDKAEVHAEAYVRQNMEKIKRLVKGYVEAKQGKAKGGEQAS